METQLLNSRLLKEIGKYNSDLKKIEDYLKQGADVHCKTGEFGGRDEWGNSPIHIAVKEERIDIVDLLLEYGADINSKNQEGYSPLYKIPWKRKEGFSLLQLLQQKGADLKCLTNSGISLLHYAALQDNVPILEYLFQNGLELDLQSGHGDTPLHWTVHYHCIESARYLLNQGAKINLQNENGNTVLHEAALRDYDKLIFLFLEFGADPEVKNKEGKTAANLAEKEKTKSILLGAYSPTQDPELQNLVRQILTDQKNLIVLLQKETQNAIHDTWLRIDYKNLQRTVLKSLQNSRRDWETNFPDTTAIVLEWGGDSQMPYGAYAFARGYSQFEVLKESFVFENEYCKFEDDESGIDFSDTFEGIDFLLKSCDKKEYTIVKELYASFLSSSLKKVFSEVFPENPSQFWYFFGCEHDQDPFLLFKS
ncbi:ankyrin repeat domain-containing protein [Leptospira noguchii]|uniref:ankyrin repeat domain-containing protein n=1 Tax=Leptospira noguchii TaxID=28182 RepID=UPI000773F593|nr:ankyrin repeat domain-containing protein [Leptospira noguchii]UOG61856.1 ankyrin repeat domain-containing protein [Leptospira noguchii]